MFQLMWIDADCFIVFAAGQAFRVVTDDGYRWYVAERSIA